MRFVEADFDHVRTTMPNPWSLVKSPEEFWGDLSTHGRRLLKELLEGTMELWRDQWIEVEWHQPAARRKSYRNGYYRRTRWATALGTLRDVRVPRCRDSGLSRHMFARLEDQRAVIGQSVVEMLLAGVSTRRVGELLKRIIDLPISAGQVSKLAKRLDAEVRVFHTRPIADDFAFCCSMRSTSRPAARRDCSPPACVARENAWFWWLMASAPAGSSRSSTSAWPPARRGRRGRTS